MRMAALEVHAFARGIVGDQYQHVPILHEALDDLATFFSGNATMDHLDSIGLANASANLL